MRRTQDRPLPSGRLQPATVAIFGGVCSVAGLVYLALAVNLLTSVVGAVTLVSYLFIYTPLKRVTWLNTVIGAIPGALPPLMGWTAARGELSGEGWALFAILSFWQMPHFLAIAWIYRDEYAKAGFMMLPDVDADGSRTAQQAVSNTLALLAVEPVSVRVQNGGHDLSRRRAGFGRGIFVVRDPVFAATDAGARAAAVFGLHHLSAAAAGADGLGQSQITMEKLVQQFPPFREAAAAARARRSRPPRTPRAGFLEQIHFLHRPQGHRHPIRFHRAVLHAVWIFPDDADALADRASGRAGAGDRAAAGKNPRPAGGGRRDFAGPLQFLRRDARHHHGVPRRGAAGVRGVRQLRRAADDRRAGHGVSAHQHGELSTRFSSAAW